MRKCQICDKKLERDEWKLCKTCAEFHTLNYTNEEIDQILGELERLNQ